ncbi:glycosyltransferase [Kitasatospora sp. MAP5-34]|uniref:glycosyltransferase n=1 Tax=Kitasatospora sp. MAP5-34 TaxID=3035102 RepID=UPI002473B3A8|nr:glycosyltransferase [Kitasatospora sp. MAP5-34]MDH6574470.1 glycosyltransferase involved in cell wall biosynthesis [Kitasatospora sp. MAP5-34]
MSVQASSEEGLRRAFPGVTWWRGRHVVVCNWRDGRHPQAGGAELYCEETARQLHETGVRVTCLTSRPRGTARREDTAYGTVVRGGGRLTVYLFVLFWLLAHRRRVDGVIDSQNGIPFFTPLVLRRRTPVVLLIHHVHQSQFALWFPGPIAALGRWLEDRGSALVYGRRVVCAVSPSSRAEIRRQLSLRGPVHLAPCGLAPADLDRPVAGSRARAAHPRIVCVGRLVTQKRVEQLVGAVPSIQRDLPGVQLHIIGDGDTRHDLERLVAGLGVAEAVVLHGRVSQAQRDALVDSAWITATASLGEGWGLSVMEAAAAGVPAIAYDVPGLRDTIRDGVTGWLLAEGEDLAAALVKALRTVEDPERAASWDEACRAWAGRFSWAATTAHLLAALTGEERRLHRLPREERRAPSDACAVVTLPAEMVEGVDLGLLRATDLVDTAGPETALLLVGADEQDAETALTRLGVDTGDERLTVRLARHADTLGWEQHPPLRRPRPAAASKSPTRKLRWAATFGALFALALVLRLAFIDRSYDVFVDELYYTTISRNLAAGQGLTFQGQFFALHPPALFAVLAGALRVGGGRHADLLQSVFALRPVIAVTGSVTVVAVTALLRRIVRAPIALAAGLLLAVDPFLNLFDSRVMLEAQANAAAVLGLLVLAHTATTPRGRTAVGSGAGLLFALAVTTKEPYALVTFVPVLLLACSARGPLRRMRLTAAALTAAGYGVYVVVASATGNWAPLWAQQTDGIARALGAKQITGFNSHDGQVSFTDRLIADLGQFGVPYLLIALGTAATVWLLWCRARRPWLFADAPGRSVVTAWAACTLGYLLYAVAVGTLEEQMFYPLVVSSTAALALTADLALPAPLRGPAAVRAGGSRAGGGRRPVCAAVVVALLTAAALVVDGGVWARVHSRHDDAYWRTVAWTDARLPGGSTVAATDETPPFLIRGAQSGTWRTVRDLEDHHVDYVVLSTELVAQGYARISPGLLATLERRAPLVHSEPGPTVGALRVYDVRALLAAQNGRPE